MNYEQACSEMNFILNNLKLEDLEKIPKSFIQFFSDNMDKNYQITIDLEKPLYEQNLLEETKAFIKIIEINYFTPKEKKLDKIINLGLDDTNENFDYNALFQNICTSSDNTITDNKAVSDKLSLVEYKKENKIISLFKNLFKKFFNKE